MQGSAPDWSGDAMERAHGTEAPRRSHGPTDKLWSAADLAQKLTPRSRQARGPYRKAGTTTALNHSLSMRQNERTYRLQVRVSDDYERAIEDFRFRERLPSRAAAIRELLRRGLARESQENSNRDTTVSWS